MLKPWEILGEEVRDVTVGTLAGGVGLHIKSLSHTGVALDLCDLLGGGLAGTLPVEAEE